MADTTDMIIIANDATDSFRQLKRSYHKWLDDIITDEEFREEFRTMDGKVKRLDNMGHVPLWRNEYNNLKKTVFTNG